MLVTAALYALAGLCLLIAGRRLHEDNWKN
jgi:hypothetical protein